MDMNNEFEVSAPIDQAWAVLTDVEKIAPCLPGAQLQEVVGDDYHGVVKVKVGPITAQFKGKAHFVEQNDEEHRAVIKGEGRGTQGNASALITATAEAVGERTKVHVHTDLNITGKVAQFGRGVIPDVSAKLMDQFAENLEELLKEDGATAGADAPSEEAAPQAAVGGSRKISAPEPEAVDLLGTAGAPVVKRLMPVIGLALLLLILRRLLRGGD